MDVLIGLIVLLVILAVCFSFGRAVEHSVRNLFDVATRERDER